MNWIAMSASAIQLEMHTVLLASTEQQYNTDAYPVVSKSCIFDFCTSDLKEKACVYEIGICFEVLGLASEIIHLFRSAKPSPRIRAEAF